MSELNISLEKAARKVVSSSEFTKNKDIAVLLKIISDDSQSSLPFGVSLHAIDPWPPSANEAIYWYGDPSVRAREAMFTLANLNLIKWRATSNSDGGSDQYMAITELGKAAARLINVKAPRIEYDTTALNFIREIRENRENGSQVVLWEKGEK